MFVSVEKLTPLPNGDGNGRSREQSKKLFGSWVISNKNNNSNNDRISKVVHASPGKEAKITWERKRRDIKVRGKKPKETKGKWEKTNLGNKENGREGNINIWMWLKMVRV